MWLELRRSSDLDQRTWGRWRSSGARGGGKTALPWGCLWLLPEFGDEIVYGDSGQSLKPDASPGG
jgi:hypothetical protein